MGFARFHIGFPKFRFGSRPFGFAARKSPSTVEGNHPTPVLESNRHTATEQVGIPDKPDPVLKDGSSHAIEWTRPAGMLSPSPGVFAPPSDPLIGERFVAATLGRYCVRLATCEADRIAACRLRFKVFNLELREGLSASYSTGLDEDRFDLVCDHLIVEDETEGRIVGTYRMQSGLTAATNLGYYSAQEFEFGPYECIRNQVLELGRASIDRQHRSSEVLTLLWRGIAQYAKLFGLRYLIGCSSLTSKDPVEGWKLYQQLSSSFLVSDQYFTVPTASFALPIAPSHENRNEAIATVQAPKLLKTYLAIGARICGPPAWDREFGTIDFLTLLDLEQLSPAAKTRFLTGPDR